MLPCRKTPTLLWVLPIYEQMLQHLTEASEDAGLPSALRLAAGTGLALAWRRRKTVNSM
jgi:hypothetical protein